ncbi:MAG: UDP-3-O-(3-hydroxymyristoyl)glucosamine N-acyltransferase [Muribaculaceae bacterium]|nr:UDP-3-O-(3-hydroxymyristoyl)glucosamine N-acyltransferase [Muribaculaceae bacterium]
MEFTARQIAALVGGKVDGNPDVAVSSFAKIEEATPGDLTFLANPKYTHYIYNTKAGIVLVREDFEPTESVGATMIRVSDPYAVLSVLMENVSMALNPQPSGVEQPSYVAEGVKLPEGVYIGAFAYVGSGAVLGRNVKIYPQAYVGPGVTVGDDSIIYPGVKIYQGCRIGRRCILQAGAVIGSDGFGFAPMPDGSYNKIPQMGIVELEDDVEVGANTTIDRATMGRTLIRRGTKLDNLIQAAHNSTVGEHTVIAAQTGIAGSTSIGSHCMIGGQVGFAGHIRVGDRVSIGAQSGIPNNVPDGARLMGYPAVSDRDFARHTVYIKRLADLFSRVDRIEKSNKSEK